MTSYEVYTTEILSWFMKLWKAEIDSQNYDKSNYEISQDYEL